MARAKLVEVVAQNPWYILLYEVLKNPLYSLLLLGSVFVLSAIVLLGRRRHGSTDERQTVSIESKDNLTTGITSSFRRDFTVRELREFDGRQPDGRILLAVFGHVYDVTSAKRSYGIGGPYAAYAGTDASRNLATFSVKRNTRNRYDDLSDLSESQLGMLREWDLQFRDKYPLVGRLLRENEPHTDYEALEASQQEEQRAT